MGWCRHTDIEQQEFRSRHLAGEHPADLLQSIFRSSLLLPSNDGGAFTHRECKAGWTAWVPQASQPVLWRISQRMALRLMNEAAVVTSNAAALKPSYPWRPASSG